MPSAAEGVLHELAAREPLFHRTEFGTRRADFAAMLADDFWEITASGRSYSREQVLDVLEHREHAEHEHTGEPRDFHCRRISPTVHQLTYTLIRDGRTTRRTTLWDNSTGTWKALFHQGTVVRET